MPRRNFTILDVFTRTKLAGNPLAVVTDTEGLSDEAMQKIAREFNLSETVFVLPAGSAVHRARIRIFTPHYEMPFAGHPTVGAAVVLADPRPDMPQIFVLEENVGPVRCAVSLVDGLPFAEFDSPRLSEPLAMTAAPEAIAAALNLNLADVGFENHRPTAWSAGVAYLTVPVSGLEALGRARLDERLWVELAGRADEGRAPAAYVYCRKPGGFRTRMLAGHHGLVEDPATGSAAAAFTGAAFHFDALRDGTNWIEIEQGVEMGRPSQIRLEIDVEAGQLTGARIGGCAVRVAEGQIDV